MSISFNLSGYLVRTIGLTYEEFKHYFGTNPGRVEKIKAAHQFFKIFHNAGCKTVFICGSFVTKKRDPEDIDLCFDVTNIQENLRVSFPAFFDPNEIGAIHGKHKCHIFHFDAEDQFLLDLLKEDRDGYLMGLVKLDLTKIDYDQK